MGLSMKRRRAPVEPAPPPQRAQVRDYRDLLARLSAGELEALHVHALAVLDPLTRASILRTAQARLLSGRDLSVDDVPQLARLVVTGEKHTTGAVLSGLTEVALDRLAGAVVWLEQQRREADEEAEEEAEEDVQTDAIAELLRQDA